jgi:hypothetical protein
MGGVESMVLSVMVRAEAIAACISGNRRRDTERHKSRIPPVASLLLWVSPIAWYSLKGSQPPGQD